MNLYLEKIMRVKAWNDEEEDKLIKMNTEENIKDVYQLAEYFQKGYRSVISKLVQLKIYEKPEVNHSFLLIYLFVKEMSYYLHEIENGDRSMILMEESLQNH